MFIFVSHPIEVIFSTFRFLKILSPTPTLILGGEKFEKNISASEKIKSWIGHHTNSLENKCKSLPENVMCQEVLHLDAKALKIEENELNIAMIRYQ